MVPTADAVYTTDRHEVIRARNIGSCMGLAALDPDNGVGGLLHALLPDARIDPFPADSISFNPYKYITTGVPLFLRHIFDMGAEHESLCLYAVGGAELIQDEIDFKTGYRNIVTLRRILWQEGVLMHANAFKGSSRRSLELDMTGLEVTVMDFKAGVTVYGT